MPYSQEPEHEADAEKVPQGRIVLDTPTRRAIFIAGLAGIFLLAPVLAVL